MKGDTQTAYVLAQSMDLLAEADRGPAADRLVGAVRHAQDGNAITITSGVADSERATAALAHLDKATKRRYGNAVMGKDTLH